MSLGTELSTMLMARDPVLWIDEHVKRNELGHPFALFPHQRIILRLAFDFDSDGRLPWETVIYSGPKKSGKTSMNALITLWWAMTQEAPNEVYVLANDLEQSQARVYASIVKLLRYNPTIDPGATSNRQEIRLSNETVIKPIAAEYAGAAGSNHGLSSWDELWGYTSERSQRLYEELTPVPTRVNSVRFITTYAGWEGESLLLWDLYRQGVAPDEHAEGQGERIHPDLPVYANREARLLIYWDHEPRLPWQTSGYYASQRRQLRAATYLRLHENRWTVAATTFLTPQMYDPCVVPEHRPGLPPRQIRVFCGVDAAIKHDSAAVVCVCWDEEIDKLWLVAHRIWQPSPTEPLDLEESIEAYLLDLHKACWLGKVYCDPYQLHRSIVTLQKKGLPIEEFPQTVQNCTRMGQALFDFLTGENLGLYRSDELRHQALNTVAVETPRGWRIAKEKSSRKIDAMVALSMGCVAAVEGHARPSRRFRPVLSASEVSEYPEETSTWQNRPGARQ